MRARLLGNVAENGIDCILQLMHMRLQYAPRPRAPTSWGVVTRCFGD
jgi:hypothetical protein